MAYNDPPKTPPSSNEDPSSSNSSNGSSSTPHTPPSPTIPLHAPPQIVTNEISPNGRHSANGAKRSPVSTPKKGRLGAIDEHSDAVSPDIPARNPLRRLGLSPLKFTLTPMPTLHGKRKPPNIWDDVEGPRGEKFSDVRNNSKSTIEYRRRFSWRTLVCIGCLLIIVASAVIIGVVVGLKVRNDNQNRDQQVNTDNPNSGVNAGFPAGQFSITSYLNNISTACTSNTATWRCYPDQTYSQSTTGSLTTLSWVVSNNDSRYTISSSDRLFSYVFQNVALTKTNAGTEDEYWGFSTQFDKVVVPSAAITDDGSNARCFFNNTMLTGRLYTKKPKSQALQNATASTGGNSNTFQPWPFALDFSESHNSGTGVPNCYKYINGQIGGSVPISIVQNSAACQCAYTNHF